MPMAKRTPAEYCVQCGEDRMNTRCWQVNEHYDLAQSLWSVGYFDPWYYADLCCDCFDRQIRRDYGEPS